jgi:hypothetical protein
MRCALFWELKSYHCEQRLLAASFSARRMVAHQLDTITAHGYAVADGQAGL